MKRGKPRMVRLTLEFSDTGKSINLKAHQEQSFANDHERAACIIAKQVLSAVLSGEVDFAKVLAEKCAHGGKCK